MKVKIYPLLSCLLFPLVPIISHASNCVTEMYLKQNDGQPEGTVYIGHWGVDKGGAFGVSKEDKLGNGNVTLSAKIEPMNSKRCIEDVRLEHAEWKHQNPTPPGYTLVGAWDIEGGGGQDAFGKTGGDRMHLYFKRMKANSKPEKVVTSLNIFASNSRPNVNALPASLKNGYYEPVGWWDGNEGCGRIGNNRYCGGYAVELFAMKKKFESNQSTPKLSKLSGHWKLINRCKGSACGNVQVSYTVGVQNGKEISKSSSIGKALGATLGFEAKAFGVGVSTEFSYETNSEQTESIMDSFMQSKSQAIQTTCNGPSEFWQWVSVATISNGNQTEDIVAGSDLVACAAIGKGPQGADIRNSAWSPK